jgi:hypothetical protein
MRFSLKLVFWVTTLSAFIAASLHLRGEAGTVFLCALVLPFVLPAQPSMNRGFLAALATWSLVLTSILCDKNFDFGSQISTAFLGLWILVGIPLSAAWTMSAMILTSLAQALWLGSSPPHELVVDSHGGLPEDGNRPPSPFVHS